MFAGKPQSCTIAASQVPLTSGDLTSSRELPVSAAQQARAALRPDSLVTADSLVVFLCLFIFVLLAQKLKVLLRSRIGSSVFTGAAVSQLNKLVL